MSPSEAPESDEPYCSTASFSSAISRALIDRPSLRVLESIDHHAGVDMVALGEALGPLLGAVAAEVRPADEGLHPVVLHLDAAVLDRGDGDGDDVAPLHAGDRVGEGIALDRLDRQRDALLLDVDVGDHRLDDVALVDSPGSPPRPTGSSRGRRGAPCRRCRRRGPTKRPNSVMFFTSPSTCGAVRVGAGEVLPRVALGLLQAERDAPLLPVDLEHDDLDLLGGGDDLARMDVLLGPGHLRDVHQALDPRLQLHEGAVVGDVGDAAGVLASRSGTSPRPCPRGRPAAASCRG